MKNLIGLCMCVCVCVSLCVTLMRKTVAARERQRSIEIREEAPATDEYRLLDGRFSSSKTVLVK